MYTFPIKAMKTPARRLEQSREESKYQVQVSEIEVKTLYIGFECQCRDLGLHHVVPGLQNRAWLDLCRESNTGFIDVKRGGQNQ